MKLKKRASLEGAKSEILTAIEVADMVYARYGKDLVVTSGTESTTEHMVGSKHYTGQAFDARTLYFNTLAEKKKVARELKYELGSDYDVVLESDHIHVEYDPKKSLGDKVKAVIDLTVKFYKAAVKFIADVTPFFRSLQMWWKGRK